MRVDKIAVSVIKRSSAEAWENAVLSAAALASGAWLLVLAAVAFLFIPAHILFTVGKALFRRWQDSRDVLKIISAVRNEYYGTIPVCSLIGERIKTFPNSRAYRAILRCCENERRKTNRRLRAERDELEREVSE